MDESRNLWKIQMVKHHLRKTNHKVYQKFQFNILFYFRPRDSDKKDKKTSKAIADNVNNAHEIQADEQQRSSGLEKDHKRINGKSFQGQELSEKSINTHKSQDVINFGAGKKPSIGERNTRYEYFNNFNQVPKSVLEKIRPLTLGLKSSSKLENSTEDPVADEEDDTPEERRDNIFLGLNKRLPVPAFRHQSTGVAGVGHNNIQNINNNIFNNILDNIESNRNPRASSQ